MKLFFYYAFCSVKNQLRKLFKTWVAIFFAVCLLFGVVIGLGAAFIEDLADIPDEEAENLTTVGDAIAYIESKSN